MLAIIIPTLVLLFSHSFDAPGYKGNISDHFDGKRFYNKNRSPKSFGKFLKWQMTEDKAIWPNWRKIKQSIPTYKRVNENRLIAMAINHSTVLIQVDGVNILTDPIWSDRTSPVSFAGPKRHHRPGVKFENLPPIDIVLISHNHYDHLDIPTLERLREKFDPLILVGLGNDILLKHKNFHNVKAMDWEDSISFRGIEFIFTQVRHWSSRGAHDRFKTLWGGFVIKSKNSSIYFAGDTGYDDHFRETYKEHGPFDLALLPIGAYAPRWFMSQSHMNPEDSVKAHIDLGSPFSMGIHFGTFQLTNEAIDDPIKDLTTAKFKFNIPDNNFIAPKFGAEIRIK